ncbi:eCIS core domain-containing protein [Streptomyces sp. SudanB182_2057]|uniref:eCIS core domain-containing protein n=1 Tax=Streptomyces sp. SudanB182_2057 TaxID=3035281 RepID=UPI003F5561CA
MHDHSRTRTTEADTRPAPARRAAAGPRTDAPGLAAFQAAAGNDAVVQMLRRAGHLPAEPHQHGAGCGHEQPEVQRSAVHDVLRAPGRPLDQATRTDMETRLGADFSDVRIHSDAAARSSAAEVGARAYTSGSHVVLGEGGADRHTLAHELVHVIQQRQGPVAGTDNGSGLRVSDPADRFEREAEATARHALAGHTAKAHDPAPGDASAVRTGAGGPAAVQRIVKITPGMYMRGVGATETTLDPRLFRRYLAIAVEDEVHRAEQVDPAGAYETRLKQIKRTLPDVPEALRLTTELVNAVNTVLEAQQTYVSNYNPPSHEDGPGAMVPVPNAATRYATKPDTVETGYYHTSLVANREEPYWGDDTTMREKTAKSLGPLVGKAPTEQPRLGQHAHGGENLPLKRLTLGQAVEMLPRPLLNLIFDVRYQLEAPDAGQRQPVIDERTEAQKADRDKSPHEPGTLRSWHQDDYGRLPDNGFDPAAVPANSQALHAHYTAHSQSGAGSSVQNAATAPRGFAEYTGTGSNWEHNVKVVLDYIQKRVYLTLTHYQYWALIPPEQKGQPYTFWQGPGQNLEAARAALAEQPRGATGIMMSPWLEIGMS